MAKKIKRGEIEIIKVIQLTLKLGGYLVLNYYVIPEELDWGGSVPVRSAFVDLTRQWIEEADLQFESLAVEDFDPKWWLFLRKQ